MNVRKALVGARLAGAMVVSVEAYRAIDRDGMVNF
jgi:hypothetical protein